MKLLLSTAALLLLLAVSAFAQCPSLSVVGPAGVTNPGDNMEFRAVVGVVGPKLKYSWSVSAGAMIKGQGTSEITVITDKGMSGENVTATVVIDGLASECANTAAAAAPIDNPPPWCWDLDSYGPIKPNDERARLDSFFIELINNRSHIGLIVLRITPSERRDPSNRRIQFILRHAKYRKFDRNRLLFALELSEEPLTIPVRISPGGEMPPCESCLMIKGGDIQ